MISSWKLVHNIRSSILRGTIRNASLNFASFEETTTASSKNVMSSTEQSVNKKRRKKNTGNQLVKRPDVIIIKFSNIELLSFAC